MMATVLHVTSGLGLRKFQADGFLLTRVYMGNFTVVNYINIRQHSQKPQMSTTKAVYEGGPKSNRKCSLVGGPVVVHASAARYLLRGPFCISLPTGIVE